MVRSGNAADGKLGHEGSTEREVPRRFRFLLFRLLLLLRLLLLFFGLFLLLLRLLRLRHLHVEHLHVRHLHARRARVRRLRVSQIVVLAQVKRELGDKGRTAPVGAGASRINRGAEHTARGVVVRKGIAIALVQIGIVVAQGEGERLPNERKAGVPGGVALKRNAAREAGHCIEAIARSQEPMTYVSRYEPADAVGKGWQNVCCRTCQKRAVGARVENRRRPVGATAEREPIAHRVGGLAVNFSEAYVGFDDVAVQQAAQTARGEIVEALSPRIPVVPTAKIEKEPAEGRPDAAVEVDLGGGAVRERDALPRQAHIALQAVVEIVSRLEVGRDRQTVVGLRNAAETIVRHHGCAERDVPRRPDFRLLLLGFLLLGLLLLLLCRLLAFRLLVFWLFLLVFRLLRLRRLHVRCRLVCFQVLGPNRNTRTG